ncbi:hypothetical protein AB0C12_12545 [Actinoplanes sp. NPDC048967]
MGSFRRTTVRLSAAATGDPAVVRCELTVGRATLRHKPESVAEILAALCG